MKRPMISGLLSLILVSSLSSYARTRDLPPPPPRMHDEEEKFSESYFGREDLSRNRARFHALEDDEGREVDVYSAGENNRAPASIRPRPEMPVGPSRVERELEHEDQTYSAEEGGTIEKRVARKPTRPSVPMHKTEVTRAPAATDAFGIGVRSHDWLEEKPHVTQKILPREDAITRRKGVQEVSVIANDLGFFPKTVFVSRDIPVRLFVTGASKQSLCIMFDSFNVKKQVKAQKVEEITFTPSQAGTYRFYCPVNGSEGTLVVRELDSENDAS